MKKYPIHYSITWDVKHPDRKYIKLTIKVSKSATTSKQKNKFTNDLVHIAESDLVNK